MAFFEVEFPRFIRYGMSGGDGFSTTPNEGFSGFEQRNRNWSKSRSKWSCSVTSQQNAAGNLTDFDLLRNFHLVVGGSADAFRLYNHMDHSISMQSGSGILAPGDGANKIFQLQKTYSIAGRTYVRKITKPITSAVKDYRNVSLLDTVIMYVNGTPEPAFTLDYATGLVTFTSAPSMGAIVAADCDFHFPVRFASDDFIGTITDSDVKDGKGIVKVASMDLMEVRL